eukprot:CAMPEP_0203859862 /NCGR_PEP_ID=MMETSP0359-20131031/12082_1 /ASSEMBLY_ACC=CAM_ASM_000338 /TAXON_ID=268821 /ORGANISM="Scrippsiella Hangoei, Strain SHTV-5" /LENGTH=296 /DNA_ID=CAMNT_0050776849 /DNA_START=46 /DNA_END=936 /DNA_ORIENTATION=-
MARPGSELEERLRRRREVGEQVFESSAAPATADATASRGAHSDRAAAHNSNFTTPVCNPPWMAAAAAAEEGSNASGGLPPWLAAAADCGVIFFDPEGREIEVPSSQVPAFKANLEKIQSFERDWAAGRRGAQTPRRGAEAVPSAEGSSVGLDEAEAPREANEKQPQRPATSSSGGAGGAAAADASASSAAAAAAAAQQQQQRQQQQQQQQQQQEQAQRHDMKMFVQKRYFALLREGLEPNEAAARAIREVATGQCSTSENEEPQATVARSCGASSMHKVDSQEGKHRSNKVLSVMA